MAEIGEGVVEGGDIDGDEWGGWWRCGLGGVGADGAALAGGWWRWQCDGGVWLGGLGGDIGVIDVDGIGLDVALNEIIYI